MKHELNETRRDSIRQSNSRRDFLKVAGGLAAGAAAASWPIHAAAQSADLKVSSKLKTRKLGSLEVSELGFGCMGLSGGH